MRTELISPFVADPDANDCALLKATMPTARRTFGLIPAVAIPVRPRVRGRHCRRGGRAGSRTRAQCHWRIAQRPAWRIAMRVQRLRRRRATHRDSGSMAVIDSRKHWPAASGSRQIVAVI